MSYIAYQFTLNAAFRKEELGGRLYYVAPVTMLVSGVLNGSEGPLFYPQEQINANPDAWNGMPIVTPHPSDEEGNPVTARRPDILQKYGIGYVYHTKVETAESPLAAEAWIDVENTKRIRPDILTRLEAGDPIEVSTGLYTMNHPAPEGANHNGVGYQWVATNFRPDHLAILPDDVGACSNADGCGIFVGNQEDYDTLPEETRQELISIANDLDALGYEVVISSPQNGHPRSKNTGRFKPYGSGTGRGPAHDSAKAGFLMIQEQDQKLGEQAKVHYQGTPTVNPQWVADTAVWDKARNAAQRSGRKDDWAYIAAVYRKMGGKVNEITDTKSPTKGKKMGQKIKAQPFNRAQAKKYLTANCKCLQGKNATVIDKLDDAGLKALMNNTKRSQAYLIVRNKSKKALEDNDGAPDYRAMAKLFGIDIDPSSDPVGFVKALSDALDQAKASLTGGDTEPDPNDPNEPAEVAAGEPAAMAAADDEDPTETNDDSDLDPAPTQQNRRTRLTPEEQEDIAFARQVKNKHKRNLVIRLTANLQDPKRRKIKAKQLMNKGLTELQEMVELLPTQRQQQDDDEGSDFDFTEADFLPKNRNGHKRYNYQGAGGGPVGNQGPDDDDDYGAGSIVPPPGSTSK